MRIVSCQRPAGICWQKLWVIQYFSKQNDQDDEETWCQTTEETQHLNKHDKEEEEHEHHRRRCKRMQQIRRRRHHQQLTNYWRNKVMKMQMIAQEQGRRRCKDAGAPSRKPGCDAKKATSEQFTMTTKEA